MAISGSPRPGRSGPGDVGGPEQLFALGEPRPLDQRVVRDGAANLDVDAALEGVPETGRPR